MLLLNFRQWKYNLKIMLPCEIVVPSESPGEHLLLLSWSFALTVFVLVPSYDLSGPSLIKLSLYEESVGTVRAFHLLFFNSASVSCSELVQWREADFYLVFWP